MKILLLTTEAWEATGGIAKFNRDLFQALTQSPKAPQITRLTLAEGKLIFLWKCWKTIRHQSFDMVICGHIHLSPVVSLMLKKIPHKKLIIHGVEAWKRSRHRWVNRVISEFDHIISVSEFTQKQFLRWAPIKAAEMSILPNCVDLQKFQPGTKSEALLKKYNLQNKKVLITLARLDARERYKGIDEVLEILPKLIKKIKELRYLIIGDGSDRLRLEQKCQTLGIRHWVEFAGSIPEEQKIEHYRLADVFVMPGFGEGFGIVYLEAMACGIPVIGSTLDGSQEALRGGKLGLLINPHREGALQKAILQALEFPKSLRPKGLDYFSFEKFQERVEEIFQ
jgi:phosphatidylinositol alpha-1,6-mannosyltransferase